MLACGGKSTSGSSADASTDANSGGVDASSDAGGAIEASQEAGQDASPDASHESGSPQPDAGPLGSQGQPCSAYAYCVLQGDYFVCDCNSPTVGPVCAADAGASQDAPCDPSLPPCVVCDEGAFEGCQCTSDGGTPSWSCLGGGSDRCSTQ